MSEPIGEGEVQRWKEALGGESFELTLVVNIEPDVVIVSEIAAEPSTSLHKNLVNVARPLASPKVDVARPSTPPKDLVYVVGSSAPPP